jgi:hypothetical protein
LDKAKIKLKTTLKFSIHDIFYIMDTF